MLSNSNIEIFCKTNYLLDFYYFIHYPSFIINIDLKKHWDFVVQSNVRSSGYYSYYLFEYEYKYWVQKESYE
jgi:hypothetical protein